MKEPTIPRAFLPISVGVFACVIAVLSRGLNETSGQWPGIVAMLLIGLCLLEIFLGTRKQAANTPPPDPSDTPQSGWSTLFLTACAAVLALVFGLLAAIAVFVWGYGIWIGRRHPTSAVLSAVVAVLVLFGFFELGLGVTLYRGMMF